jgi:hypothetical protein
VNREGTMNKLKMLALTAPAAATIGTGALAAAPSASAMPAQTVDCGALKIKYRAYFDTARILYMINNPEYDYYFGLAQAYWEMLEEYCRGGCKGGGSKRAAPVS